MPPVTDLAATVEDGTMIDTEAPPRPLPARRRRRAPRLVRALGTLLVIAGALVLVWSFVVWRWNDPITALYTLHQQRKLDNQLDALLEAAAPRPSTTKPTPQKPVDISRRAAAFRNEIGRGRAIGRLVVPRLGLNVVVVNGTDTSSLKKGPGRDERTFMPGQGNLVYIAGHRTTYGAPFGHIERMKPGDRVTITMPYATFVYRVTGHTIVDADDLSVLRPTTRERLALQACHPRFFATQRYIVWASLAAVTPR